MATYNIPFENTDKFENKLDKLAKTAEKLGLQGPVYRQTNEHYEDYQGRQLRVFEYEVDFGVEVLINGWMFVCAIEHTENGNVIKGYDPNVDPKWYTAGPNCEHCGMNRKRNMTYVLRNELGQEKQVGSTCLKDFTGHPDAEYICEYFTGVQEFIGSECEDLEFDPDKEYSAHHIDVFKYMTFVAMSVRKHGYISRKQADYQFGVMATSDDALTEMFNTKRAESPSIVDATLARKVADFVAALEVTNDFEHNIKVLCTAETAHYHNVGYIAGAFSAYLRDESQKAQNADSEYVGTIGQRQDFALTLKSVRVIQGYYGDTHLYKFADENGNAIVWFSSKNLHLVVGDNYEIKATVKEHKEYNHEKQTTITRGKML